MSQNLTSGSAGAMSSRTAVVAFLGDVRREAREKNLPPRFLNAVHCRVAQTVRNLPDTDLLIATHRAGRFQITRDGAFCSADAPTLAEQVDHALRACFRAGYRRVLLLAGDIADSPASELRTAIDALDSSSRRMTLGRSSDGGFYLVGFNALPSIDWKAVPWHTASAAAAVTVLASAAGLEEIALPPLDDIDSLSEAWRLLSRPSRDPQTRRLRLQLRSILSASISNVLSSTPYTRISAVSAVLLRAPPSPCS